MAWRAIFDRNRAFAIIDEQTGQGRAVMDFTREVSFHFSVRRRNAIGASDRNTITRQLSPSTAPPKRQIAFRASAKTQLLFGELQAARRRLTGKDLKPGDVVSITGAIPRQSAGKETP